MHRPDRAKGLDYGKQPVWSKLARSLRSVTWRERPIERLRRIKRFGPGWYDALVGCSAAVFSGVVVEMLPSDGAWGPGVARAGLFFLFWLPWIAFFYWFYGSIGWLLKLTGLKLGLGRVLGLPAIAGNPMVARIRSFVNRPKQEFKWKWQILMLVATTVLIGLKDHLSHGHPWWVSWAVFVGGITAIALIGYAALGERALIQFLGGEEATLRHYDRMIKMLDKRGKDTSQLRVKRRELADDGAPPGRWRGRRQPTRRR